MPVILGAVSPTAIGGRAEQSYFGVAILESRGALHLGYRLAVRFVQWTGASGAAAPGTGLWRAALPAFVVLDVATWLVLRRNRRFGLGWRALLDGADIAFWSLSPLPLNHNYDTAVLIGVPLSVEAGFRVGIMGLLVPVVGLLVAGPARILAGLPVIPFTFAWLVLGIGLGMAAYSYCGRLHDQAVSDRTKQRAADSGRAFLVGQNAVAMGADSVVDAIEGVVPVLGRPQEGSALWRLADGWKARLAADTSAQATYLQVALLGWESAHNRHPDLSTQVQLFVGEGMGTILLTGRQVRWLHHLLDDCHLRGTVSVAVAEGADATRSLGAPLSLGVGVRQVRVPADRTALVRPVDIAPVTYGLAGAEILPMLSPTRGGLRLSVACSGIALCAVAAWWSHRQLMMRGGRARPAVLCGAIVMAVVLTVLICPSLTHPLDPDGATSYSGLGIFLLAIVGGFYWHGLGLRLTTLLIAVVVVCIVLIPIISNGPFDLRALLCSLALSVAPFPMCREVSENLARATERDHAAAADEHERATEQAFSEGRESVLSLVRMARDDAKAQLADVAPRLEPDLAALVGSRLEEVDRRLESLSGGG